MCYDFLHSCLVCIFFVIFLLLDIFIQTGFSRVKAGDMASGVGPIESDVVPAEDEELGDFLLLTDRLYDCFFVVGNADQGPTERIGAVKACLMNQSRVFRNMLHDSQLAERGDIMVPDIQPPVFRLLLKHCYGGLENCRSLTAEMTVKLCYAAEKYLIGSLKKKVADRLKPECASEIFPGLHCLVTYNVTELENFITEIVREQTDKIFSSEGFMDIDVDSMVFIVKQETLNCSEVEIWRAVIKWANHKAQSEERLSVREWMSQTLKHIRLMTLSYEDLCKEVLPSGVLSFEEFCQVSARTEQESDTICTLKESRGMFHERWKWWETVTVNHELREKRWSQSDVSYSCLVVGDRSIMLESVTCLGSTALPFQDCYGLNYACQAEIVVSRITDYIASTPAEEPVVVKFNGSANYYEQFTMPTLINGESITLQANSMFKLKISFVTPENNLHPCWLAPTCSDGHTFSHGKFYCSYIYEEGVGWKPSHIVKFQYSYRR
ncbi:BTB/POZ domain-containing protein 3-like isoform X1 [Homalodisca vitripennis]|uniref:BTB/POZ domain-containing protein 3-like isoform X1 n=1 Tax=Homalodisca vitripennis TaxID=197043 RepID=UPI001EEA1095|nr:BTB/POZ domain-containing protein 3-like isoform X1 [Homalodisca vitripennis]